MGRKQLSCCGRSLKPMKIKIVVHEAEEGGFWAEAPALPGCVSQGETLEEVTANMREAIEGYLDVDVPSPAIGSRQRILDVAI
jgi:predicted RNase H-like HicB family nuclease